MGEGNADNLRLFVACELPDDVRSALGRVQGELRGQGVDRTLRWVRPESIHLTLKFLRDVERARLAGLRIALAGAIEPFSCAVRPAVLGTFGGARVRVVWAGLEGDVACLSTLAGRIDEALAPLGFPRERRPFAGHLTLARVRDHASPQERRELAELVGRYGPADVPSMILREASLMASELGPGGSVYRRLATFPEAGGATSLDALESPGV